MDAFYGNRKICFFDVKGYIRFINVFLKLLNIFRK